jgi:hypothetical protein
VVQRLPGRDGLLDRQGRQQCPRPVTVDDGADALLGPRLSGLGDGGARVGGGHSTIRRLLDLPGRQPDCQLGQITVERPALLAVEGLAGLDDMLGRSLRDLAVEAGRQKLWKVVHEWLGEGKLIVDRLLGHSPGHAQLGRRSPSGTVCGDPVCEILGTPLLGEGRGLHAQRGMQDVDGAIERRDPIHPLIGRARVGARPEFADQLAHAVVDHVPNLGPPRRRSPPPTSSWG